jgi:hypothetical protein
MDPRLKVVLVAAAAVVVVVVVVVVVLVVIIVFICIIIIFISTFIMFPPTDASQDFYSYNYLPFFVLIVHLMYNDWTSAMYILMRIKTYKNQR